jgi:hypothetical protein
MPKVLVSVDSHILARLPQSDQQTTQPRSKKIRGKLIHHGQLIQTLTARIVGTGTPIGQASMSAAEFR